MKNRSKIEEEIEFLRKLVNKYSKKDAMIEKIDDLAKKLIENYKEKINRFEGNEEKIKAVTFKIEGVKALLNKIREVDERLPSIRIMMKLIWNIEDLVWLAKEKNQPFYHEKLSQQRYAMNELKCVLGLRSPVQNYEDMPMLLENYLNFLLHLDDIVEAVIDLNSPPDEWKIEQKKSMPDFKSEPVFILNCLIHGREHLLQKMIEEDQEYFLI